MDATIRQRPAGKRGALIWKVIACLLLNIALLAVMAMIVFQWQFKFNLNALMAGPVGDRVNALARTIVSTLRSSPPEEWDDVLRSFGSAYKVDLALLDAEGRQLAGAMETVPDPVLGRVTDRPGPPGERVHRGPPPGKAPRRAWGDLAPDFPIQPRFTLKTDSPRRYWIGFPVPPTPMGNNEAGPHPWTLLLATGSLYSGGLFLDTKIWIVTGSAGLLLSLLLWAPLIRGLAKSISDLTRATDQIANGNLSVRVPENRSDELGRLGASVNRMAERLEGFVKSQKRFLGDTAHELCSPLARMQVAVGILEESRPDLKTSIRDLREELDEMSALINELLSFSKAGLAAKQPELAPVPLLRLVKEAVRRELGEGFPVHIHVEESSFAMAQPDLLGRAVANLLRNAKRYAAEDGPLTILDEVDGDHIWLRIRDGGHGVPDEDLPKIFDPFYRAEQSRSRDTGGAGLGLSIVKTCVEACGGSVRASNLKPGFEVSIRLHRSRS